MQEPHEDHTEEAHSHPGEDFPRVELAQMVGRAQAAEARRHGMQAWALALGLGILCLGVPSPRYFTSLDWLWGVAGSGPAPHGLLAAPILGLDWLTGWSLEPCAYLISACFLVASFFAQASLLKTFGFAPPRILLVTVTAMLAPMVWLGATLPLDYTAALFGATMLARSLFRTQQDHPYGYLWRASSWLTIAFFLSAQNLWLLCPTLWAVIDRPRDRAQGWLRGIGLLSVFGVVLGVHASMQAEPLASLRRALFGAGLRLEHSLEALTFSLAGLGVLLWGLIGLFAGKREPEESPPPIWALVWVAVALGPLLAGGQEVGPTAAWLVPMAAVGLAVRGQRFEAESQAVRQATYALGLQVILTAVLWPLWRENSEQERWTKHAALTLEATDGVISEQRAHAYLAAFRFELPAVWLSGGEVRHSRNLNVESRPTRWALDATETEAELFFRSVQAVWNPAGGAPPGGVVWLRPLERLGSTEALPGPEQGAGPQESPEQP